MRSWCSAAPHSACTPSTPLARLVNPARPPGQTSSHAWSTRLPARRDPRVNELMARGIKAMETSLTDALAVFEEMIQLDPGFAEVGGHDGTRA